MSSLNERALWRGQPCAVGAWRGQISAAGILIGCIGCIIITASSVYTALKMGALPWPTIFTSITALVLLRAGGPHEPERGERDPGHHVRGLHGRRRTGVHHPRRMDARARRGAELDRDRRRGTCRHASRPGMHGADPPPLRRGIRSRISHRHRRRGDAHGKPRGRCHGQAALRVHGGSRRLGRPARRGGRRPPP